VERSSKLQLCRNYRNGWPRAQEDTFGLADHHPEIVEVLAKVRLKVERFPYVAAAPCWGCRRVIENFGHQACKQQSDLAFHVSPIYPQRSVGPEHGNAERVAIALYRHVIDGAA
jgi:hypothetical protein